MRDLLAPILEEVFKEGEEAMRVEAAVEAMRVEAVREVSEGREYLMRMEMGGLVVMEEMVAQAELVEMEETAAMVVWVGKAEKAEKDLALF